MKLEPPLQSTTSHFEEALDTPEESAQTICELGTVGWDGDEEVAEMGSTQNSGANYIKVTLFNGAPSGKPASALGFANGHQVLARLLEPARYIPSFGKPCVVLFPGGKVENQGSGLCLPVGGPSQLKLPNERAGEVCMHGEAGQFVRMKKNGEVVMYTTNDGTTTGQSVYLRVSPTDGFEFSAPYGRMRCGPMGIFLEHNNGTAIRMSGVSGLSPPFDALGSTVSISAATAALKASAVSLGTDAGAANAAAVAALLTFVDALIAAIGLITSATPGATAMANLTFTTALAAFQAAILDLGKIA